MRRAALRFLSAQPASLAIRSRTITSFSSPLRTQRQTPALLLQKRWASDESNKTEEAPISQIQPTPQEEVENTIHEDNAASDIAEPTESAADVQGSAIAESTESTADVQESAVAEPTESAADVQESAPPESGAPADVQGSAAPEHSAPADDATDTFKRSDFAAVQPKPTVYIGNLFFDVTEDDLSKEMSRFGNIERLKLIRDNRGLSKGFAYVTFNSTEAATTAISSLNQQLFEGRRLIVQYAATNAPPTFHSGSGAAGRSHTPLNPPSKTLFIGNMSWSMTDRDLNNLFRGIKNIIDVRVAIDRRTGQPRGFAHADFVDVKSAMEAMNELNGKETYGRKLKLDYSYGSSGSPKTQARDRGDL